MGQLMGLPMGWVGLLSLLTELTDCQRAGAPIRWPPTLIPAASSRLS